MIGFILFISISIILLTIVLSTIMWAAWKPKAQKTAQLDEVLPDVAVLVAVRDEVDTIEATILSLLAIDYPKQKLNIIIGDDGSSDGSTEIIKKYADQNDHFKYILVKHDSDDSDKAKGAVLAKIAENVNAEYLMFTDGDIVVPESWVKKHLSCLKDGIAIQSGFTIIKKEGFFSSMQMIDWSFALGMVKIVSGWGIPVTAVGNNMLIKKSVYDEVGGFAALPFTVTEDFAIFNSIVRKGYKFQQLANQESLAYSAPAKSLKSLIVQRKRWMVGAMQLPVLMKLLLVLQALYFPAIICLLIYNPLVGIPLFGLKITIQSLFLNKIHERLGEYMPLGHLFIFEFYSATITIILCLYYLLPLPVNWKGRKLKNK